MGKLMSLLRGSSKEKKKEVITKLETNIDQFDESTQKNIKTMAQKYKDKQPGYVTDLEAVLKNSGRARQMTATVLKQEPGLSKSESYFMKQESESDLIGHKQVTPKDITKLEKDMRVYAAGLNTKKMGKISKLAQMAGGDDISDRQKQEFQTQMTKNRDRQLVNQALKRKQEMDKAKGTTDNGGQARYADFDDYYLNYGMLKVNVLHCCLVQDLCIVHTLCIRSAKQRCVILD